MNELYIKHFIKLLYHTYFNFLDAEDGTKEESDSLDLFNFFVEKLAGFTSWMEARKTAEHMAYLARRSMWKHCPERRELNCNINMKACFEM